MLLFVFLSVCPIHFHHLDLIVKLIGCCFVFLHSSLLLMVSGHFTPKDSSEATVQKDLKCFDRRCCFSPCFKAVEKDIFYIRIEEP